ncbi:MAG: bifunctional riboflavin kinase/FAD synthetase [Schleiferiaceae bacterium]|nr:bifunctional riboflavin kinase/FAD synthetase [Schleiferiaceae bacterium]
MKIYHSIAQFKALTTGVATAGTFDGLHAGHQAIIQRLIDVAKEQGGESILLTFDPHPRKLIHPEFDLALLTTMEERAVLLDEMGLDHLIIQAFDKTFSQQSSLAFVRNQLVSQMGVKHLVIGYDHRFGRNREGGFDHLVEYGPVYGFDVEEIPVLEIDQMHVSSTTIRQAVKSGDMQAATKGLTRPYQVSGQVIQGHQVGRKLGFATANMGHIHPDKLMPAIGVYAVTIDVDGDQQLPAIANHGVRPTFGGKSEPVLEVHVFDCDKDLYGHKMVVHFNQRIRDEKAFESPSDLSDQMALDIQAAKKIHNLQ